MLTALVGAQTTRSWSDWLNGRAFTNPGATVLDQFLQAELNRRVDLGRAAMTGKTQTTASRFTSTGKYTAPTRLAAIYATSASERTALAKRLAEGLRAFEADNQPPDVAGAFANLFILAYTIAQKNVEIGDTDDRFIVQQCRAMFEDPKVRNLSDAAKQEYYEWCTCTGDLLFSLHVSALQSKDRRAIDYVKGQAASLLKRLFKTEAYKIKTAPGQAFPIRIAN